jgi:hypothetical protein
VTTHPFAPPQAFRHEVELLRQAGISSWDAMAGLDGAQLRRLGSRSPGSESRLIRLRGQAALVIGVDLAPEEAALLLHAGIADPAGLAAANPHSLQLQVGRLQRRLTGTAMAPISLARVQGWIQRARGRSGRSWN